MPRISREFCCTTDQRFHCGLNPYAFSRREVLTDTAALARVGSALGARQLLTNVTRIGLLMLYVLAVVAAVCRAVRTVRQK